MSRSSVVFGGAALALFIGCGTVAAQAPADVPCQVVLGKDATVSVDGNAMADPECLTVKKGQTTVTWTGTADVKTLQITFKDPGTKHPPEDPACAGAQCVSDKLKLKKVGTFDYSIVVVRQDGSTATVDPKLIIQP